MDYLAEARRELSSKTREQLEAETAYKWAARAVVAHERGLFRDAIDFAHEALEHGAFADETGEIMRAVRSWILHYAPHGVL